MEVEDQIVVLIIFSSVPEGANNGKQSRDNDLSDNDIDNEHIECLLQLALLKSSSLRIHHNLRIMACKDSQPYSPFSVFQRSPF